MPKLTAFNHMSLDGYFVDACGDMSWAHRHPNDDDFNAFVARNASGESMLLFGRVTYELMSGYWPTPAAQADTPALAERMNNLPKVVFSRTLHSADWNNTQLITDGMVEEVRRLKVESPVDMVVLGSGTIVAQLTQAGLLDEIQVIVNPIVLGSGRTMFDGVAPAINLELTSSRAFKNGLVALFYVPVTPR